MSEDIYHLYPMEDTHTHRESDKCPCNPEKVKGDRGVLFIHNAFDGRELYEKVKKDLKENKN